MGDPVSRVAQCYAEGAESPRSAACGAAVAAGGTQALYDWNGIRIGDANGRHQQLIPDGKLCSPRPGSRSATRAPALGAAALFLSVRRRAITGGPRR